MKQSIAYKPDILASMDDICRSFKVGTKQVRTWVEAGAPIAVEGEGCKTRYSAEALRLQLWRENQAVMRRSAAGRAMPFQAECE